MKKLMLSDEPADFDGPWPKENTAVKKPTFEDVVKAVRQDIFDVFQIQVTGPWDMVNTRAVFEALAAPVQPVQAPMTERERRAPARREEMAAFAAELKADPVKAQRFFHEAGILDAQGNLTPQYGGREQALPDGWVPLVVTLPDSHPEEVAYGPKVMMDRLGKWLAKHFAAEQAQGEPVAQIGWADEFGNLFPMDAWKPAQRTHHDSHKTAWRPVFAHPPRADAEVPFRPETWPVDADGFAADLCTECGTPVRYGSRHTKCGTEVARLRAALESLEQKCRVLLAGGYDMIHAKLVLERVQRALRGE